MFKTPAKYYKINLDRCWVISNSL